MVHGVEAPQAAAVEEPMRPVPDEVADEQDLERLQPGRLPAHGARGVGQPGLDRAALERQPGGDGGITTATTTAARVSALVTRGVKNQ